MPKYLPAYKFFPKTLISPPFCKVFSWPALELKRKALYLCVSQVTFSSCVSCCLLIKLVSLEDWHFQHAVQGSVVTSLDVPTERLKVCHQVAVLIRRWSLEFYILASLVLWKKLFTYSPMEVKFYRRAKHSRGDNLLCIQTEDWNFMLTPWRTMLGHIHKLEQILQYVMDFSLSVSLFFKMNHFNILNVTFFVFAYCVRSHD